MASIGIDLGTTNSAASYYNGEHPILLPTTRPDGLIPSVVAYRKPRADQSGEGTFLVGQTALDYAYKDPANAIFSIKRLMGRSYSEPRVAETITRANYSIVPVPNADDSGLHVRLGDKGYTPVEISAMILEQIKLDAERALGQTVTHAVITVPAYFEERQRAATREAGKKAGLIIKRIIDEPSAAAIAYGFTISRGERRRLLVFDLGGGTFDVSIISTVKDPRERNHFESLVVSGDNWLGGDDFDNEIVGEIAAWVKKKYDYDPTPDKIFQLLAKQAAERAKITLSSAMETDIILPVAYKLPSGEMLDLDMAFSRQRFEELIRPHVERAMTHVREALSNQNFRPEEISNVLMVGGSTLVPLVRDLVVDLFGKDKVQQVINPHHAVALGAGILAGTMHGIQCSNTKCQHVNEESRETCANCGQTLTTAISVGSTTVTDITAMSYGICTVMGEQADAFEVIIPKGTVYPLSRPMNKTFYTTAQNLIRVPVFEGVNSVASKNEEQGTIELDEEFFRREGAVVPLDTAVEISMNYSRDRILQVKVRVHGTNIETELTLRHDRRRQAATSEQSNEDLRWKEGLENLVQVSESFLSKYAIFVNAMAQKRLSGEMAKAQETLLTDNPQLIREAYKRLDVALHSCGIASLLFQAEQLKRSVKGDRAGKITAAIDEIKEKWLQGDQQAVTQLAMPLRVAVAELAARDNIKDIHSQTRYRGLLRKS